MSGVALTRPYLAVRKGYPMVGSSKPPTHHANPSAAPNQRERLYDALRANLRRRKDQARQRTDGRGDEDDGQARPTLIQKNKS